jgi:putative DNA primase/helicase
MDERTEGTGSAPVPAQGFAPFMNSPFTPGEEARAKELAARDGKEGTDQFRRERPDALGAAAGPPPKKKDVEDYTDQNFQELQETRLRHACRLARQGFHFAPAKLGCTHGEIGWPADATTDRERIKAWVDAGKQLVMVAKFGKCAVLDFDDFEACKELGFDEQWLRGMLKVDTPSGPGHFHCYLPWSPALDAFPKDAAKADAFDANGNLVAELKLNNSTVAAPGSLRFDPEGKKCEGAYVPVPEQGAEPCPDAPAVAAWFRAHGNAAKAKPGFTGRKEPWEFHPDFDKDDFLEHSLCSGLDPDDGEGEGWVDGSFHLAVDECPLCDKEARKNTTLAAAVSKFIFSGTGYGFVCHACGTSGRREFEEKMAEGHPGWEPWDEDIYRHDNDALLFADAAKAGWAVEMAGQGVPARQHGAEHGQARGQIEGQTLEASTGRSGHASTAAVAERHSPAICADAPPALPAARAGQALAVLPKAEVPSTDCGEMEVGDYGENITCTDLANGKRLARWCGNDLCYVIERKCWHVWDGKRWGEDKGNIEVARRAKEVAKSIFAEADGYPDEKAQGVRKWAWASCQRPRIDAMIGLAKSEGTIAKSINGFDHDPHLFNCQNGVIDLRTGELLPHRREYLMMNISPVSYVPGAQCPAWLRFLDRIQRGDQEMIGFLQRLAGYSMVGSSEEESLNFLWGGGNNGKGKTLETLRRVYGDYATTVSFATFLEGAKRNPSGPSEELACLAGKRMVTAQESNVTGRFNEALIKTLTGRDRQRARFLHQNSFEFDPAFTLWLASNNQPRVIDQSEGTKRRIKLIPFTVHIPEAEVDRKLPGKLWAEREGILAWCVRGAVEWLKDGLRYPAKVQEASKEYFANEDVLGQWLGECTEEGPYESRASLAYDSFKFFAEENNFFVLDAREFKSRLVQKGYESTRMNKGVIWKGFKVTRLGPGKHDREPEFPAGALD